MVTKDPRYTKGNEEVDVERAQHQEFADRAHQAAKATVAMKYDAPPPKAPTRTIPSANQVAAMKEHPEYEMWKDYRKEKD